MKKIKKREIEDEERVKNEMEFNLYSRRKMSEKNKKCHNY